MLKVFSVVSFLLLCGCKKSDTLAPVITVSAPGNDQVFTGGQTVLVKATITDDQSVHMVHVTVLDNLTDGHVVHFEQHTDSRSYEVNQSFQAIEGRSYTIDIEAADHADNTATKKLTVSAN